MFGFVGCSCLLKHQVYELVFPVMHRGRFGEASFGIGPYVFKINSFNSHASMSMQKRKFCDNGEEELISLYPLSVMTGAFEEGEE